MLYNQRTVGSPEVMSLKNQVGELDYNQSKFEKSYKTVKEVTTNKNEFHHTEIAKSHFILAKIAFSRGEQKNAFETMSKAKLVLRKSIVKRE